MVTPMVHQTSTKVEAQQCSWPNNMKLLVMEASENIAPELTSIFLNVP